MAVREENVACRLSSVKVLPHRLCEFLNATMPRLLQARDAESAIIQFPVVSLPECRVRGALDRPQNIVSRVGWNALQECFAEHGPSTVPGRDHRLPVFVGRSNKAASRTSKRAFRRSDAYSATLG